MAAASQGASGGFADEASAEDKDPQLGIYFITIVRLQLPRLCELFDWRHSAPTTRLDRRLARTSITQGCESKNGNIFNSGPLWLWFAPCRSASTFRGSTDQMEICDGAALTSRDTPDDPLVQVLMASDLFEADYYSAQVPSLR